MQRDRVFVEEMIAAAERARELTAGVTLTELENDGSAATRCCGTSPSSARQRPGSPKTSRRGTRKSGA